MRKKIVVGSVALLFSFTACSSNDGEIPLFQEPQESSAATPESETPAPEQPAEGEPSTTESPEPEA